MKKFITVITVLLMSGSLMLVLTGCPTSDKDDYSSDVQTEDGVNHQFEDGVTIPPGGERVREGEWHSSGSDSSDEGFSIVIEDDESDLIVEDSHSVTFEVDLDSGEHSYSHSATAGNDG